MKKIITSAFLILLFSGISKIAFSQDQEQMFTPVTPKWISEKGFWQIESNKSTPENSIIYFFNNDGTLVYKEKIEGLVINLKKKKVLMTLKKVLEESVVAYEQRHSYDENANRVATLFRKSL
jgi:hypothetical protein